MKPLAVGAVIAAALLTCGAAAKFDPRPQWVRQPTPAQWQAALPRGGARAAQGGYAAMRCKVGPDGGLLDCKVVQEYPAAADFGKNLLSLASLYQAKPAAEGGVDPGGQVLVPGDWLASDKPADWQRKPVADDLLAVWPKKAWARGVGGTARIDCLVSVQGALFDCVVATESPANENFGAAAIALTPQFLMRPAILNGQPVVSPVSIPINFVMPAGAGPMSSFGSKAMVKAVMAWPEAPTYADVAAAYPRKARAAKLGGRATLDCTFTKEGRLTGCRTIAEEPHGQGFADAAKALAKRFRAFPTNQEGASVAGAGVQLPVTFDPAMLTSAKPVVGKPEWAGLPTFEQLSAAFGSKARPGTSRVAISCTVKPGGGVGDCTVDSESPADAGLGAVALTLAPRFRLSTWTAEGLPIVGGAVRIPLRYEGGAASKP